MVKSKYPELDKILKEMCKRVGANFKEIDFKGPDWYTQYSWTEEEQEDFQNWMIDYLYNNVKARNEIMEHPVKNKQIITKLVGWFTLDFGWKLNTPINSECGCAESRKAPLPKRLFMGGGK